MHVDYSSIVMPVRLILNIEYNYVQILLITMSSEVFWIEL